LRSPRGAATLLGMETELRYRQRIVREADLHFIRQLIAQHPQASRKQLSKKLCAAWNWVQPNGALCDMVCRGLMLHLHRAGLIELPPVRCIMPNPLVERRRPTRIEVDTTPWSARLAEIEPLEFRQVRRTPDEVLFDSLLEQYHYLRHVRPVGENLKFLILAQQRPIACLAWSSPPRHLGCRDHYIGWSGEARRRNLHYLAYNLRYLLLPWISVRYLASHLLAGMTRRLSAEWQQRYAHPLYFVETFIDPERFRGSCYRAANWKLLGWTTGRGKDDIHHRGPNRSLKQVLGYPLIADFRERLQEVS
jgi:Domain of unknown function (DUF4338)